MLQNNNLFGIVQKVGDPKHLCGHLVAYALIDDYDKETSHSPFDDLVQNGIIAVTGEYEREKSLKDFLNKEFGSESNKNFDEFIEQIKNFEGKDAEEDESMRKKFESFNNMEIIPVPARILFFDSEQDALNFGGDVFCLGHFKTIHNAHLSVTSFPILYQGMYREQQARNSNAEITDLLSQIESTIHSHTSVAEGWKLANKSIEQYRGNLKTLLLNEALPKLIYNLKDTMEFESLLGSFKLFMKKYRVPSDIDQLITYLYQLKNGNPGSAYKLELMCEKISAVHNEQFELLESIQNKLKELE